MSDVAGYCLDGACLCVECAEILNDPDSIPMLDQEETDSPVHCENCGALISSRLTARGYTYVYEQITRFLAEDKGDPDVIMSWVQEFNVRLENLINHFR